MTELNSKTKQDCPSEAGRIVPVIDRAKCEAKADCVQVCPYQVFEVRQLTSTERKDLSLTSQVKLFVHGGKQAFAVSAENCHACGLCVKACPEKAIKLIKSTTSVQSK